MKPEMPPSLTDCVTTGAFANPSVPQFPHLSNESAGLVELRGFEQVRHLVQCLASSQGSVRVSCYCHVIYCYLTAIAPYADFPLTVEIRSVQLNFRLKWSWLKIRKLNK